MTKAVKRKALSRREFGLLIIQQEGKCGCGCEQKLDFTEPRRVIDEHLIALDLGGTNDLDNRALYRSECARSKTNDEAALIAKGRRIRGEQGSQNARRDRRKERGLPGIPQPKISPLSKKHPNYRKAKWI
ncbi:hypothetical protein [Ponticaulis profundi]|uniref:HNH endonuclease n=1 Tax=Ponticaulis profundi TaxID=2665222 RepID=A0ABW1S8L1_9PROT